MLGLKAFVSTLLLVSPALIAQEVAAGTVIPAMLQTTLDGRKARVGQKIVARVMQDVPLSSQTRIRAGAKLIGHVIEVMRPSATSGSRIVMSFDRLMIRGAEVPVTTSLRSLASMMEVFEAQMPTTAFYDRGTSQSDWVTVQIGGDAVYRGAGMVTFEARWLGNGNRLIRGKTHRRQVARKGIRLDHRTDANIGWRDIPLEWLTSDCET